jgi:hypothetical protein
LQGPGSARGRGQGCVDQNGIFQPSTRLTILTVVGAEAWA